MHWQKDCSSRPRYLQDLKNNFTFIKLHWEPCNNTYNKVQGIFNVDVIFVLPSASSPSDSCVVAGYLYTLSAVSPPNWCKVVWRQHCKRYEKYKSCFHWLISTIIFVWFGNGRAWLTIIYSIYFIVGAKISWIHFV